MFDKHSFIILKIHYESIFLIKFIHIFKFIFIKVYCNMDNSNLIILMLYTGLYFKFIYNIKKLQVWQSKKSP